MDVKGRRIALALLLLLTVGAGVWLASAGARPSQPEATSPSGRADSPEPQLAMLEKSLRAVEDGVREAPRDRWDPAYVVQLVGRHPDSLAAWVRENTTWIPYRGALRGPVGVLMDRQGNSLDRALLLAALLTEAGHAPRLAHADLPAARASELLPELVARRSVQMLNAFAFVGSDSSPVADVAARYDLDAPEMERVLDGYAESTTKLLDELDRRVPEQAFRLIASIAAPDPVAEWTSRRDSALAALGDHWWVQVERGGSWADLDLLDPGAETIVPRETMLATELPPSLRHAISIRVIAERVAGGALAEQATLAHDIRPGELIGQPVVLQFWPAAWPGHAPVVQDLDRSTRRIAASQDTWSAVLMIGNDLVASGALAAAGSAAGAAAPAAGLGGLGGLGGAIRQGLESGRAQAPGDQDSLLTAVWIEYRLDVPGREQRIVRRAVFDLIGEAARRAWTPHVPALSDEQRLTRALSLMMRTEILPLVSEIAPEFVLHLHGRSLLANADLVRAVSLGSFGRDQHAADSLLRLSDPAVSPLYTLAVLRRNAIREAGFIDRPAILTRHQYPKASREGLALEDATDIVANEVGIALTEEDGFAARLGQGVWDTNLEALLAGSRASANTALAYATPGGWRALTAAGHESSAAAIGTNEAALMQSDLERGYTVVAPGEPLVLQGEKFAGWWRIDPVTGDALGVAGTGWGQSAPGYGLHIAVFVEMAKPFVFAYALCQYIPQAANSLNIIGYELWARVLNPSWTGRPDPGKDFEDVALENHRRCVIDAILAGFVATAPLLLQTMRARQSVLAGELRASRLRPQAFRTQPSMPGPSYRPPAPPPTPLRGPRGTLPSGRAPGANPLGRTEPGLRLGGGRTPGEAARGAEARAKQAYDKAERDYYRSINDFIQAKNAGPALTAEQRLAHDRAIRAAERTAADRMHELESARNAAKPYKPTAQPAPAQPVQPAQPPQPTQHPGCPPNCGNERATVDGQNQLQQSGLGTSFWKITWPD